MRPCVALEIEIDARVRLLSSGRITLPPEVRDRLPEGVEWVRIVGKVVPVKQDWVPVEGGPQR